MFNILMVQVHLFLINYEIDLTYNCNFVCSVLVFIKKNKNFTWNLKKKQDLYILRLHFSKTVISKNVKNKLNNK